MIGAGDIVRKRIVPALRENDNCDLIAVSRGRGERAEAFAAEFGIGKWYGDWRAMLADDEIQAVYVASPVYLHAGHTVAAAEAGKHVLCEKPMAMNVVECDAMIAACRANNVKLGIAYYRRFYPVIERIRQIIASSEIGKPVFCQMNTFEFFNPGPDFPRHWFVEKEKSGGGPMMDFGCHRLEILTNLFGKVVRTESLTANVAFDREVEDTAAVLLQFDSGTCASLVVTHASHESRDTLDIYGTRGAIHIERLNDGELTLRSEGGERREVHPPSANFHTPMIRDFADALIENRDPRVGGDAGRIVAEIEDDIYRRKTNAT